LPIVRQAGSGKPETAQAGWLPKSVARLRMLRLRFS